VLKVTGKIVKKRGSEKEKGGNIETPI